MWNGLMERVYGFMVSLQVRREEGQTLVEYALIIAVVSVLLVGALTLLRTSIAGVFTEIEAAF